MAYLDLWSRNWDENIISPVDYEEFAYGSGYIGTQACVPGRNASIGLLIWVSSRLPRGVIVMAIS